VGSTGTWECVVQFDSSLLPVELYSKLYSIPDSEVQRHLFLVFLFWFYRKILFL